MKTIIQSACRIACITVALTLLVPLLPGITFAGSFVIAVALGGGLWLLFEASRLAVHRLYGVGYGACPTKPMMRKLLALYVAWSVLYVLAAGMVFSTPLHVANVFVGAAGGCITLVGAIVSNVFERLLIRDTAA